jgi:hypothetical protein
MLTLKYRSKGDTSMNDNLDKDAERKIKHLIALMEAIQLESEETEIE